MIRTALSLAIVVALASNAAASLHIFNLTSGASGSEQNVLSVVGGSPVVFELAPPPPTGTNQFVATTPFQVQVTSLAGPHTFTLNRASTTNNHVNLIFNIPGDPGSGQLGMFFDVPGIAQGDAVPASFVDADGVVEWNAPALTTPNGSAQLAGRIEATVAVPEPSAFAFGGLVIGLVGVGRVVRSRFRNDEEATEE